MERRAFEVSILRDKYGEVETGANLEYIIFKNFRLPQGWNRESTELLIIIPAGYPVTPPDNFYVAPGLRLQTGAMPGNYSEGQQHFGRIWGVFSMHIEGGWTPSSNLMGGDNLITFMLTVVEKRLNELN